MRLKQIRWACVLLLALIPATARADNSFLGGLVGSIVGTAIMNGAKRQHQISAAQAAANVEVQKSLNYFGYNVGAPDGVYGQHTAAGVSAFQALLHDPVTGRLTQYEYEILTGAYHRALAGGPQVSQTLANDPMGPKALILQQRDIMAGIPVKAPAPAAPAAPAATAAPKTQLAAASGLPTFMGTGGAQNVSLSSFCNKVGLQTTTNGELVKVASATDAQAALSEQFCLGRSSAISTSDDMQAKISGFTPQQIQDQCKAFGTLLKDQIAELSLKPETDVLGSVQKFVVASGMPPAQLSSTVQICLGVGYKVDDLNMALGSALVLAALGQDAYAELLGHHLEFGFGTQKRPDLALVWYRTGLKALQAGGGTQLVNGMAGRATVMQAAVEMLAGGSQPAAGAVKTTAVALPNFSTQP